MVEIRDSLLLQTGLSKEFILKEIALDRTLNAVASMPVNYAIFGGTAINKIYAGQKRFSEDIDIYVFNSSEAKFTPVAKKTFPGLAGPARIFRESYRYSVPYSFPENGASGEIKLDVNFNLKASPTNVVLGEPGSFLNNYGFYIRNRDVRTFTKETLTANKLLAISGRCEGRDYFDLNELLTGPLPPRPQVMHEAHRFAATFFDFQRVNDNFLKEALVKIRSAKASELSATDQYILRPYRPDWNELVKTLEMKIRRLAKA